MGEPLAPALDLSRLRADDNLAMGFEKYDCYISKTHMQDGATMEFIVPVMELKFIRGNGTRNVPVLIPAEMVLPMIAVMSEWIVSMQGGIQQGATPPVPPTGLVV